MIHRRLIALCFAWIAVLAGCSTATTPTPATAPADSATATAGPTPAGSSAAPGPVAASTVATVTLAPHLDPASPISRGRSIYFDYDEYSIKTDYASLIQLHSRYLVATPALVVRIEGNTDERGGAEYNLALGQKRAEAVLKALQLYGVADAQMEAISWGEERPRATGHDEAAWAENRRVDLVYPGR